MRTVFTHTVAALIGVGLAVTAVALASPHREAAYTHGAIVSEIRGLRLDDANIASRLSQISADLAAVKTRQSSTPTYSSIYELGSKMDALSSRLYRHCNYSC